MIEKDIILASGVKVDFIDDQDLCSYYKATLSCFKNLKIMRQLLIENRTTFSNNCTLILLNATFEKDLGELVNVFKHICNIIEKRNINYVTADAIEDWKGMENDENNAVFKTIIEENTQLIYKQFVLVANFLHPAYRGKQFKQYEQETMLFLIEHLNEAGMTSYFEFLDNKGIFATLLKKEYVSWKVFWKSVLKLHSDLAKMALKILSIPAYSDNSESKLFEKSNLKNNDKMLELFYLLKISE